MSEGSGGQGGAKSLVPALPSALEHWPEIAARLAGARPALFLDYDGTLTPIVARPELATLSEPTRDLLRRLASRWPVAILSGRAREDVAALVGLPEITYAGSHGFDIAGPGLRHEVGEGVPETIERATAELRRRLAGFEGVLVEPKRFTVAVHYRLARPEDLPAIEAAVDSVLAGEPGLRKAPGKKVWELRPDIEWDKGQALRWILAAWGPSLFPIYTGDDVTDEDAFREVAGTGLGILVADKPRPTAATYGLRDTAEVRSFLERLAAL